MHRRDFLARLLAGATGAALAATFDLEKLLWVPGAKTILLPAQKVVTAESLGISIRMVRQFDIQRAQEITRLDVLYGAAVVTPELTARVRGAMNEFPARLGKFFEVPLPTDGVPWRVVDSYCELAPA